MPIAEQHAAAQCMPEYVYDSRNPNEEKERGKTEGEKKNKQTELASSLTTINMGWH